MKQQVNLLDPAFLPKRSPFPAPLVIALPLILFALLLVFYGYSRWQMRGIDDRLAQLREQELLLAAELATTTQRFPRKQEDPELLARIAALDEERTLKLRVLETLKGKTLGDTSGYTGHLEGLARHWADDLQLTRLEIGEGGKLRISGRALDPQQVPRLVSALAHSPAFADTAFRTLRIRRPEEGGAPEFLLDTQIEEPDDGQEEKK